MSDPTVTVTLPASVWADVRGELASARRDYTDIAQMSRGSTTAVNAKGTADRLHTAIAAIDAATAQEAAKEVKRWYVVCRQKELYALGEAIAHDGSAKGDLVFTDCAPHLAILATDANDARRQYVERTTTPTETTNA